MDRLFLGLRDRSYGRESFREIGDFVAHRRERQKGLTSQVCRDVFTSIDVWSMKLRGKEASLHDLLRAARANFRLASGAQLKRGCGMRRAEVERHLESAATKIGQGDHISSPERTVMLYLGNHFIWKPAFTDDKLYRDFRDVLLKNGLLTNPELPAMGSAKSFLALYAISVMHGCSILYEGGEKRDLLAGFANRERRLEVKVQIKFELEQKPILAPICMFLTSLSPEGHCESYLLKMGSDWQADAWCEPIELNSEGKLALVH